MVNDAFFNEKLLEMFSILEECYKNSLKSVSRKIPRSQISRKSSIEKIMDRFNRTATVLYKKKEIIKIPENDRNMIESNEK